MATPKTTETEQSVSEFITAFAEGEQKRTDSYQLIKLMKETTGLEPKMWGPSIIGFGSYHYRYPSGHEGDAPLIGFSPRKAALSLYVYTGFAEHEHLLDGLGKFKMGKACIYIKKLSDIDLSKLTNMMIQTIRFLKETYAENK